jgi:hypothetical protein
MPVTKEMVDRAYANMMDEVARVPASAKEKEERQDRIAGLALLWNFLDDVYRRQIPTEESECPASAIRAMAEKE